VTRDAVAVQRAGIVDKEELGAAFSAGMVSWHLRTRLTGDAPE